MNSTRTTKGVLMIKLFLQNLIKNFKDSKCSWGVTAFQNKCFKINIIGTKFVRFATKVLMVKRGCKQYTAKRQEYKKVT